MVDPDALRYLRIAQADGLAGGIGYRCQRVRDDTVEISSPDWPLLLGITVSLLEQVQGDLT
jgi:hypothetical protein